MVAIERSGPAILRALAEHAPGDEHRFEAEFREALTRTSDDLDLSRPQAVLARWHARAMMAANALTDDELAQVERARAGDFTGLFARDEQGNWTTCSWHQAVSAAVVATAAAGADEHDEERRMIDLARFSADLSEFGSRGRCARCHRRPVSTCSTGSYGNSIELDADKTVAMVTLPSQSIMHIFETASASGCRSSPRARRLDP